MNQHTITKSTDGYDSKLGAKGTTTMSGLTVGSNEQSQPRGGELEPPAAMQAEGKKMPEVPTSSMTSTMNVGCQYPLNGIKPAVGCKVIEGSNSGVDARKQGDFAKSAVDEISRAGGPRSRAQQFRDNSKLPDGALPKSFLGADSVDEDS